MAGAGLGVGEGDGLGDGLGVGEGEGEGLGEGLGEGEGLGDGLGVGAGDGLDVGEGVGAGDGLGAGEGEGEGLGDTIGAAGLGRVCAVVGLLGDGCVVGDGELPVGGGGGGGGGEGARCVLKLWTVSACGCVLGCRDAVSWAGAACGACGGDGLAGAGLDGAAVTGCSGTGAGDGPGVGVGELGDGLLTDAAGFGRNSSAKGSLGAVLLAVGDGVARSVCVVGPG